jgi:hypothetical protein
MYRNNYMCRINHIQHERISNYLKSLNNVENKYMKCAMSVGKFILYRNLKLERTRFES